MKHILLIAAISLSLTSCSKEKELSQEEQERNEPLKENQIIENEKGGLNFFLYTTGADISVSIYHGNTELPVIEKNRFQEYEVLAEDLQDNTEYTIELKYHSVAAAGSFDFMAEGFTALTNTKKFWIKSIPISVSDAGTTKKFLKMSRGIIRYTFTSY
jgi:hypothetical protein